MNIKNIKEKIILHKYYLIIIIILIIIILILLLTKNTSNFVNPYEIKVESNDNFLFLGDSITDYYPLEEYYDNLPVVNSGIAGNKTTDILSNMKERVYQYNPTKVFLLIGTNDIDSNDKDIVKQCDGNIAYLRDLIINRTLGKEDTVKIENGYEDTLTIESTSL